MGKASQTRYKDWSVIVGGIAMTIPDYIALGVLITLILLGAGRLYLETRRF